MKTKPLNEIIDECIEYSTLVNLGSELYCTFWRFRGFYDSSCDLQKIPNPKNKRILTFRKNASRQLFERYMNVNEFKACKRNR